MSLKPPFRKLNELERICALSAATGRVRFWREGGRSWDEIAKIKSANPVGLSPRSLERIYSGPGKYDFDSLRRAVRKLP